jgi:large subunit ribosomal protein L9
MAKTEIILTSNVEGLGAESDQLSVAAGYARNYLFPNSLAIPVSSANKKRLDALKKRRVEREASELQSMQELGDSLSKLILVIQVRSGEEGRMFGSITASTIAEELESQYEVHLERRKIHLEDPIRVIGDHEVELRLHPQVQTTLKVRAHSINAPTPVSESSDSSGEATSEEASA